MKNNNKKQDAQFARIESYALAQTTSRPKNPPANWKAKTTVEGACGEAERLDTHIGHLKDRPGYEADFDVVYGMTPMALYGKIKNRAAEMKENGERFKSDQCVMSGGVFSYPGKEIDENFFAWLDDCMEYLKKKYPDNFQSAVVHYDESNPHLHFYLVDFKTLSVNEFDPARIARRKEENKKMEMGKDEKGEYIYKPKMSAQKEALKEWLDDFCESVSKKYNHAREIGARKARLYGTPRQVARELDILEREKTIAEKEEALIAQRDKILILAKDLAARSVEMKKKSNLLDTLLEQMEEEVERLHKARDAKGAFALNKQIGAIRQQAFGAGVAPNDSMKLN